MCENTKWRQNKEYLWGVLKFRETLGESGMVDRYVCLYIQFGRDTISTC